MPAIQSADRLDFGLPLAPKAGKPIAVSELLKRLKTVHNALASFEQGAVDLSSLKKVAKDLASTNLLHHKDKGVRAYVACCLADILRLFAPDAPYTVEQLQDIFEQFVGQLRGLADTESPYILQYCYLLESLSQVKSIVLVADLPNGENLMTKLFQMFFDMAKSDVLKNIEFHMTEILVQLVDEVITVSPEIIAMIIAQFLRPIAAGSNGRLTTTNGKSSKKIQTSLYQPPPAFNMAKKICINCADRMSRFISQYFTDTIYEFTSKTEDLSDSDLTELKKAHQLIVEMWKAAPEVLQSVIPQIDQELQVENTQMRILATQTIGTIAGETPGRVNFISSHPTCWEDWLGRQNDKVPLVRAKWADGCAYIIGNRPDIVKGTVEGLGRMLIDADDKVRLSACKAAGSLDYQCIVRKFHDPAVLANLAERVKDRKLDVRTEAIEVLGNLYNSAFEEIANQDAEIVTQLAWIPSRIFDLYYLNNAETSVLIDYCVFEHLLPAEQDDTRRVTRLMTVIKYLDEKPRKAFNAVSARQKTLAETVFKRFLELSEDFNDNSPDSDQEAVKASLDKVIRYAAALLPDAIKSEDHINKFVKLNDRRLFKLMGDCMNPESDIKTVYKSINEFKSKLSQFLPAALETMMPLLYRSSIIFYNRSNILPIVEISKHADNSLSAVAHELLKDISTSMPSVLKWHIQDITKEIQDNRPGFDGSVETLKACSGFARRFSEDVPQDKKFLDALMTFALEGSPKEAKHAVKILLQSKKKHAYARDLLGSCENLNNDDEHFLSHLATIAELVYGVPALVDPDIENITEFLIKTVLLENRLHATAEDKEWAEDTELNDDGRAKLLALQILVNRLRACEDAEVAKVIAEPVLKLLSSLIVNEGEISTTADTPLYIKSRLRLAGGTLFLKLAKLPLYESLTPPDYINRFVLLVQDANFQVRQLFLEKLKAYLASGVLPERYLPLVFLVAYEPEEEVKDEMTTWIKARMSKQQTKNPVMERSFSRLLHLLAHHPDYGADAADLLDFAQYIIFYLNAVVTEENISLIFYFAQRVKQVRDAVSNEASENLYYLSDLAQAIIRLYGEAHSWSMQTWPGKIPLPADIFRALPSPAVAQKIARTSYLPDGVADKLISIVKPVKTPRARPSPLEKPPSSTSSTGSKKRKSGDNGSKKKSKAKKAPQSDDEWDGK
ncbi:armadillo-type protein [Lipomyces arxii]|uniref:armadillo-type protein n=1 Tax=Lipomyces arxii TaxID=56418 RepID=UPI0034CDF4FC